MSVSVPYLWRHSSMTSTYVSRHISCMGVSHEGKYCTKFLYQYSLICSTFLRIETSFNLVKIQLIFRIIPLIQWNVMFVVHVLIVFGDWNIYSVCFPNICWHSGLKNQWKYVKQTKFVILYYIFYGSVMWHIFQLIVLLFSKL